MFDTNSAHFTEKNGILYIGDKTHDLWSYQNFVCNYIIKLYFSKPTNTILGARWVCVLPDEVHCTVAVEEVAGEVAAVAVVVAAVAVVAAAADTAGGLY